MAAILKFDGASKGNPGKAGAGAVLMTEDGRVVSRISEGLGVTTNNVAEYRGLILGLKHAIQHGFKRIVVHGDSQLVSNQVNGVWQTKNQTMRELCNEVRQLKDNFDSFEMIHVQRESNAEADRQANIGTKLASNEQFVEDQECFDDQDPQEFFEQDGEQFVEDQEFFDDQDPHEFFEQDGEYFMEDHGQDPQKVFEQDVEQFVEDHEVFEQDGEQFVEDQEFFDDQDPEDFFEQDDGGFDEFPDDF